MSWIAGFMLAMSLPAISGAAIMLQRLKWDRYSTSVMPPLPTSSMSGSFQWPCRATDHGSRGQIRVPRELGRATKFGGHQHEQAGLESSDQTASFGIANQAAGRSCFQAGDRLAVRIGERSLTAFVDCGDQVRRLRPGSFQSVIM